MSPEIEHIAYSMLKDPKFIEVSSRGKAPGLITQTAYPVAVLLLMAVILTPTSTPALDARLQAGIASPADLSYLGRFTFAVDPRLPWTKAPIAVRVVNGQIRIFVTGHSQNGNPLCEYAYPGEAKEPAAAPVAEIVKGCSDAWQGRLKFGKVVTTPHVRGLLWHQGVVIAAYGEEYAAGGIHQPSVLAVNPDTGAAFGPWRTSAHSQQTRGYLLLNPRTGRVCAGAPITSGNGASPWGFACHEFKNFDLSTPPSSLTDLTDAGIATTALASHPIGAPQRRFDTNYLNVGWNCSVPNVKFKTPPPGCSGVYDTTKGGWSAPGSDFFTSIDTISAAAWVKTSTVEGVIGFGHMVRTIEGHKYADGGTKAQHWYGPGISPFGQNGTRYMESTGDTTETMETVAWFFDPNNLQVDPRPVSLNSFAPGIPSLAKALYQFGGAAWEPTNRLLFLSEYDPMTMLVPLVHVFRVR